MNIDELRARIQAIRDTPVNGKPVHTWAQVRNAIVLADSIDRVSRSLVWKIANVPGYEPKNPEIRHALGLPDVSPVTFIDGKSRPPAQALDVLQCACGRYFVSNHPRRGRCFVCGPFRGRKRK